MWKDRPMHRCHAILHFILYNYLQMHLWRTLCHWPRQENFTPCFRLIYDNYGGGTMQNWQNILVRMRKFTFIKGIKVQLKPPYKN